MPHDFLIRPLLSFNPSTIRRLSQLRTHLDATVAAATMNTTVSPTRPLKILMLHGYTQTGPLFRSKTRALEKNLAKAFPAGVTLSYPTGPTRLTRALLPTWDTDGVSKDDTEDDDEPEANGWWVIDGDRFEEDDFRYKGLETGFKRVAQVLRDEGPFDGVIGFSQGAAMAAMVASLLDQPARKDAFAAAQRKGGIPFPASMDNVHPPLKFAVSYSGFAPADHPLYAAFYEPKIKTPMLHFLGSLDTVVEESKTLRLVDTCEKKDGRVIYHPGGHFVPSSQKQYVSALVAFIREVMAEAEAAGMEEENVEDMDVPF